MNKLIGRIDALKSWQAALWFGLIIFVSFGKSVFNGYSLDDNLGPNHQLVSEGFGGIPKAFTQPMDESNDEFYGYRPISIITFILERQLFGQNPGVSHFINLLLYLAIVMGAYRLLLSLGVLNKLYSLVAVSLFAVHSLHSEVVLSLKNRDELISALFVLLAFLFILRWQKTKSTGWFAFGIIAFAVAMLAKVSAAPFFLIIASSLFLIKKASFKKSLVVGALLFAAGSLRVVLIRLFVEQDLGRQLGEVENPLSVNNGIMETLIGIGTSFFFYMQKLLFPYPLSSYYGKGVFYLDEMSAQSILGLVGFISLSLLLAFKLWKKQDNTTTWVILGLWAILLPYLNWPLLVPGFVADRLAFMAVLFISILFVKVLSTRLKPNGVIAIACTLFVPLVWFNTAKTTQWATSLSLLENDSKNFPNSIHLHYLLGKEYVRLLYERSKTGETNTEMAEKARSEFEIVLNSYDEKKAEANNALGTIHTSFLGLPKQGHNYLIKASELVPQNEIYWYNRAKSAVQLGLLSDGIKSYQELNTLRPSNFSYHAELSDLLLKTNQPEKAYLLNKEALRRFPKKEENIEILLGIASAMQSNLEAAISHFERAHFLNPENEALAEKLSQLRSTLQNE